MRYPRDTFNDKQNKCISIAFVQAKILVSRGGILGALRDEGLLDDFTQEVYLAGLLAYKEGITDADPKEIRRFTYRRLYRALRNFGFRKLKNSYLFVRKEKQFKEAKEQ